MNYRDMDRQDDDVSENNSGTFMPVLANQSLMPEIKGFELLEKIDSTLNVGKTINEMFSIIQNMESQLKKVLSINGTLEKDLKASKEMITDLKTEKLSLENKIAALEEEIPSKKELQAEIDHLIKERNDAQPLIRDMKIKVDNMKQQMATFRERIVELEEEKSDLLKEINFFEVRMDAAVKKASVYEKEINILKGERIVNQKKLKYLEDKCRKYLNENDRLVRELRESKEAIHEIHARLADTKLKAKKSFYETYEDETTDL